MNFTDIITAYKYKSAIFRFRAEREKEREGEIERDKIREKEGERGARANRIMIPPTDQLKMHDVNVCVCVDLVGV